MTFTKKSASIASVLLLTTQLTGCWEPADVTFFEPGVYKGAPDPLVGNTDIDALAARMEKQKDR